MLVSIILSDIFIIFHEMLFGTNGAEYFIISTISSLLGFPIYFHSFSIMNITTAVDVLAIVFAHNRPSAPDLIPNINIMFNIIVPTPKIKFENEYSFILLSPLASALLSPINILDTTNAINAK